MSEDRKSEIQDKVAIVTNILTSIPNDEELEQKYDLALSELIALKAYAKPICMIYDAFCMGFYKGMKYQEDKESADLFNGSRTKENNESGIYDIQQAIIKALQQIESMQYLKMIYGMASELLKNQERCWIV